MQKREEDTQAQIVELMDRFMAISSELEELKAKQAPAEPGSTVPVSGGIMWKTVQAEVSCESSAFFCCPHFVCRSK